MTSECPICYQPIKNSVTTSCNHTFCYSCFTNFVDNSIKCPMCRGDMFDEEEINHIKDKKLQNVEKYLCENDSIITERSIEYISWLVDNNNNITTRVLLDFRNKIKDRMNLHQPTSSRPTTGGLRLPSTQNNLYPTVFGMIDFTGYTGRLRTNGVPDARTREYGSWVDARRPQQ